MEPSLVPSRRRTWRRHLGLIPFRLSTTTWIALVVHTLFLLVFLGEIARLERAFGDHELVFGGIAELERASWPHRLVFVLSNYVVTICYFQFVGLLLRRWPAVLAIANAVSIIVFVVLFTYRWQVGEPLDYTMLEENGALLRYRESWRMIWWRVSAWAAVGAAVMALATLGLATGTRLLARWPRQPGPLASLVVSAAGLAGILCTPLCRHNELTYFVRTAYDSLFPATGGPINEYPYYRPVEPPATQSDGPRPHVFIVMLESFNGRFVGRRTESGQEYTPFVNQLRYRGLTVDKFYGNSVQTRRGQVATLCSIMPSIRRDLSTRRPFVRLRALPAVLRNYGYQTLFFQAYKDLGFDNTGPFMTYLGFDTVAAMDDTFVGPRDEPYLWGWGLQDDKFYEKFFGYLDRRRATDTSDRPYFSVLATISHHMPFLDVPKDQRRLFPEQKNDAEAFANSINVSDGYLREFFAQLERRPWLANSIVIITADHSFPGGEHNNFQNEKGAYEESFRAPFIIIWPGRLAPRAIDDVAYSQLDIAPTVLDLLGIRTSNHFIGRSIFAGSNEQVAIPLIQPYSGIYLAAVIYPMKYVWHSGTGEEFVFNVEDDPHEDHNLLGSVRNTPMMGRLNEGIERIMLNQRLIEQDRIWPGR